MRKLRIAAVVAGIALVAAVTAAWWTVSEENIRIEFVKRAITAARSTGQEAMCSPDGHTILKGGLQCWNARNYRVVMDQIGNFWIFDVGGPGMREIAELTQAADGDVSVRVDGPRLAAAVKELEHVWL